MGKVKKANTILLIFLWLVLVVIVWLSYKPLNRGKEGEWEYISNNEYGFSVEYPTKWIARMFGENGYRGQDEVKLVINDPPYYKFQIEIQYWAISGRSLEGAIDFSNGLISRIKSNAWRQGNLDYEQIDLWKDSIDGHDVMRRRYRLGESIYEEVYIARTNDIIVIEYHTDANRFELYLDDFNRIIMSFRPVE